TYRRALHLEDLSMYSPVWLVEVERSSERNLFRVDAVNGTIIKQPSVLSDSSDEQENIDEEKTETNRQNIEEEMLSEEKFERIYKYNNYKIKIIQKLGLIFNNTFNLEGFNNWKR